MRDEGVEQRLVNDGLADRAVAVNGVRVRGNRLEDVNSLLSAALKTHYQVTDFHRLQYRLTMLEPSATIRTPAPMSTEASSPDTSFWVAHGKAM